ncbi:MAG: DMT family transporter [Rhizobiaceae bacterium]|nr:DMT family transporter [Rhizobiaceae bacterium]
MHLRAYIYLLLTTLFWGGNVIAGKLAVGHISPMLLTAGRWGLAFLLMLAIGFHNLKRDWPLIKQHWMLLAMLGILGFALFNVALYTALEFTSALNVSIEQAAIPMLIFLLNFLFFRTRASWGQIAGLLVTLLGVALTASHGELRRLLALDLNFGDAIMLVSILVYAGYTVMLRYRPNIHWHSLMIALSGAAFVGSLPFAVAEFASGSGVLPDTRGWSLLLYAVIFPSLLAQVLYVKGIELIGANRAGLFINLVPVFGAVLSILLLGEAFHLYHAVALALVFGGIALAEISGRRVGAAPA